MGDALRIGVVGCGVISTTYLETAARVPDLEVVAVSDVDPSRAARAAQQHGVRAVDLDDLWSNDEVEWILDLTTPGAHADVALKALTSGFSVYNEKPSARRRTRRGASSRPRPRPGWAWEAPPTPSWARGSRPLALLSRPG
ncbi:Gfo/Idh/MocA family oxidoreductase [Oerskovia sp. M15]